MGVSMDAFVQALLVERSALSNCGSNGSSSAECVVVIDNARHHAERWSDMPRRLRTTLLPNNKDPTRRKLSPKKKPVACANSNSNNSRPEDRWSPKQEKKAAIPAPPSCPQRQQSIEVTAEALAHMTLMDGSPSSFKQGSPEVSCVVQKAPRCPERRGSVEVPKDQSPQSVLQHMGLGDLPRMPERQASDDSGACSFMLPPPPMDFGATANKMQAPLLGSFSSSVKRSKASLLDDDDDSDSEEEACLMLGSARLPNFSSAMLQPDLGNTLSY